MARKLRGLEEPQNKGICGVRACVIGWKGGGVFVLRQVDIIVI